MISCVLALASVWAEPELVTLQESYIGLDRVCQELTKATGVEHQSGDYFRLRKVAVYCDQSSAEAVRGAVERLTGGVWARVGDSVRLMETSELRIRERKAVEEEKKAVRGRLLESLKELERKVKNPSLPFDESAPGSVRELMMVSALVEAVPQDFSAEESYRELVAGGILFMQKQVGYYEIQPTPYLLRFDESRGALRLTSFTSLAGIAGDSKLLSLSQQIDLRGTRSFGRVDLSDFDGLAGQSAGLSQSQYRSGMAGLAEHSENVFRSFGVPVIADAYRRGVSQTNGFGGLGIEAYLNRLVGASRVPMYEAVDQPEFEDGWVVLRHSRSAELSKTEPTEAQLSSLEDVVVNVRRFPSLEEYGDFAARLKDEQGGLFTSHSLPLVRFPSTGLSLHLSALTMIGSSRLEPLRDVDGGISGWEVADANQDAGYDAFVESVTLGGECYESILNLLRPGSRWEMMNFSIQRTTDSPVVLGLFDQSNFYVKPAEKQLNYAVRIHVVGVENSTIAFTLPILVADGQAF